MSSQREEIRQLANYFKTDCRPEYFEHEITQLVESAQLQLISEIEEALPKPSNTPESKITEIFLEQVRTILATKRGEISNG